MKLDFILKKSDKFESSNIIIDSWIINQIQNIDGIKMKEEMVSSTLIEDTLSMNQIELDL